VIPKVAAFDLNPRSAIGDLKFVACFVEFQTWFESSGSLRDQLNFLLIEQFPAAMHPPAVHRAHGVKSRVVVDEGWVTT